MHHEFMTSKPTKDPLKISMVGDKYQETSVFDLSHLCLFIERDIYLQKHDQKIKNVPIGIKMVKADNKIILEVMSESKAEFDNMKQDLLDILSRYNYWHLELDTGEVRQRFYFEFRHKLSKSFMEIGVRHVNYA